MITKEDFLIEKLEGIVKKYDSLIDQLSDPKLSNPADRVRISKERAEYEEIVHLYGEYKSLLKQMAEADEVRQDPKAEAELKELADLEWNELQKKGEAIEASLKSLLIPKNPQDDRNLFLEIRAGTGGNEAALFASDLLRMYTKYAEKHGWKVEVIDASETGIGGFKEIVLSVTGKGAYRMFQYESGVHRVQRVPETEASGRIHTSTVTVAVIPEAEEVDIQIDPKDLRIDTFCSSGAGGQSVNTTYSAVRITHAPSGLVVSCQDERSQLKNRTKAMRVLRSRLLEMEREKQDEQIAKERKSQVGTGDRSEKIRTYNFKENRVTDHRINLSLYQLEQILQGELDPFIQALIAQDEEKRIQELKGNS
ncbi:MAG TPA: peptide chain release factor 1 [Candidatus Manganitrophaceae bacterium]|nr:peptide chain release factor 1 [Candidatus Manganitrophaceae bacterium]